MFRSLVSLVGTSRSILYIVGDITVPGEKLLRPHIFFFVLGQPASVNDVQGIMLHKLPKMKLWGYQIAEEGFILWGLYQKLLRAMELER